MIYQEYQYLYPPRPERKVPPSTIGFYEKRGYLAQVKKNGTCTVIFARGDQVIFKTRHNDDHKAWTPKLEHVKFFQSNSTSWSVFVGELLHSKTPHIKDQLYLFDLIVDQGEQLVGSTFLERQKLLYAKYPNGTYEGDQQRVHQYVSLAVNFASNFNDVWSRLKVEDEGLVFKKLTGKLEACFKPSSNEGWQCKSRRPHANYSF